MSGADRVWRCHLLLSAVRHSNWPELCFSCSLTTSPGRQALQCACMQATASAVMTYYASPLPNQAKNWQALEHIACLVFMDLCCQASAMGQLKCACKHPNFCRQSALHQQTQIAAQASRQARGMRLWFGKLFDVKMQPHGTLQDRPV